jgi:hypothetical protein
MCRRLSSWVLTRVEKSFLNTAVEIVFSRFYFPCLSRSGLLKQSNLARPGLKGRTQL